MTPGFGPVVDLLAGASTAACFVTVVLLFSIHAVTGARLARVRRRREVAQALLMRVLDGEDLQVGSEPLLVTMEQIGRAMLQEVRGEDEECLRAWLDSRRTTSSSRRPMADSALKRALTARSLGVARDVASTDRLARLLGDNDARVRRDAAMSLAAGDDHRAAGWIVEAWRSELPLPRMTAAAALLALCATRESSVIGLLEHRSSAVRALGADVLGHAQSTAAIGLLRGLLTSTDPTETTAARTALERLGAPGPAAVL